MTGAMRIAITQTILLVESWNRALRQLINAGMVNARGSMTKMIRRSSGPPREPKNARVDGFMGLMVYQQSTYSGNWKPVVRLEG